MTKPDDISIAAPPRRPDEVQQRGPVPVGQSQVQPVSAGTPQEWAFNTLRLDFARAAARRRRSFLARLFLFVGVPTLLAAFYVLVYATPRYVSQIQIVYQSYGSPQTQAPSLLSSFLGSSIGGLDMQRVISSYVGSSSMLEAVERQLPLRAHYSSKKIDRLDRLPASASEEDFLSYFKKRVKVDVMMGGYDVITVEAFDPKTAAGIAGAMANSIDSMVEGITIRARNDEMKFAENLLESAEQRLLAAKLKTTEFRNAHREFDPMASAETLETTVVGGLEAQLSQYRAELASRRPFLGENSPTIKSLESQIQALDQQISDERTRLATSGSPGRNGPHGSSAPYSDLVAAYTTLSENEQFALNSYTSAKQAYDLARADAARKENYVECFVKANVPQRSTSPDPVMIIFGTFLISLLLYAGGSLLASSFRDQAGL